LPGGERADDATEDHGRPLGIAAISACRRNRSSLTRRYGFS